MTTTFKVRVECDGPVNEAALRDRIRELLEYHRMDGDLSKGQPEETSVDGLSVVYVQPEALRDCMTCKFGAQGVEPPCDVCKYEGKTDSFTHWEPKP